MFTARKAGFCRRKSKVSPSVFFDLMMYDVSSATSKSLNQIAIEAKSEHDIGVSKQGIDKKFNEQAVAFMKLLIEKQLSQEVSNQIEAGWLSSFNRVSIKDGTRFDLPDSYKEYSPGSGGSASNAGACLQFEYDLKSGHILDLTLTAANRPDARDATEVLDTVSSNDLVIRDLGYYAFKSLLNITSKGAYFISRLGYKTNVYKKGKGELEKLDFKALYFQMKQHGLSRVCENVLIGTEAKIPVRLVIELMPESVYEQRMKKTKKIHKKKGYQTSGEYKFMSRFNLFITNAPERMLPDEVVPVLYRVRWQIELIFKIWKSVIGIHHTRKMKYERWLCLLHFKLLLMIINWNLILLQRNYLYKHHGRLLSLNKCFKTLFDNSHRLRRALNEGLKGVVKFINWLHRILSDSHWLEKKKKSLGLEKIFYLFYCKSNVYPYI
jgi:Transposase DDE domain